MVDIPEHLLLKTAEARAKALGISVEQALAEMRGEAEPTKTNNHINNNNNDNTTTNNNNNKNLT